MRVVRQRSGEDLVIRAVAVDGADIVIVFVLVLIWNGGTTGEKDEVAAGLPVREVVPAGGERGDVPRLEVHNAQTAWAVLNVPGAVDELAAVRRVAWETVIVSTVRELLVYGTVGSNTISSQSQVSQRPK